MTINIPNKFAFPSIFEKKTGLAYNHSTVMIIRFELTFFTDKETEKKNNK